MDEFHDFAFDNDSWGEVAGGVWRGGSLVDAQGELVPGEGRCEKEYKTVYGPVYRTAACHNAASSNSILNAATRLLSKRKPLIVGLHEQLIVNQGVWFDGASVQAWADEVQRRVTVQCADLSSDHVYNMGLDAARKCPKMKLRMNTWEKCEDESCGLVAVENMKRQCDIKFKKTEVLEQGKKNRVTADLRTLSSLVGGYVMPYVKTAFAQPYDDGASRSTFIESPTGDALACAFERLISGERDVECIYYSDDSCFALRCVDSDGRVKVLIINADISACDGSHFRKVFETAQRIMSGLWYVAVVVSLVFDQLRWVMKLTTPDGRSQKFRPSYMRLYSGSVLTTIINNVANMAIFLSVRDAYKDHQRVNGTYPTTQQALDLLERAAARAGYIVTSDVCECYEDIQFLKRSFSIIDGKVTPWLNLGVWFLKFGTIDGELPGSQVVPLAERARRHNAGVVLGRTHDGDHLIHDAFKTAHPVVEGDVPIVTDYHGGVGSVGRIPLASLARRYRMPVGDLEQLAQIVSGAQVGQSIVSRAVETIVAKDYGISW